MSCSDSTGMRGSPATSGSWLFVGSVVGVLVALTRSTCALSAFSAGASAGSLSSWYVVCVVSTTLPSA